MLLEKIIKEELGISNKVSLLTLKIKNLVSNDYALYQNNSKLYQKVKLFQNEGNIFGHWFDIKFEDINLKIIYFVLYENKDKIVGEYRNKYESNFNIDTNTIKLFLVKEKNNKINWKLSDDTLQHEIEHFYEQYMKGKNLFSNKKRKNYNLSLNYLKSNNKTEQFIGFIYYYYNKFEQNAIMNGLYRKIMEINKNGLYIEPYNIIKEYRHYNNINNLKKTIDILNKDIRKQQELEEKLKEINKSYNSFIRMANTVIEVYTKKFARTIYKAKKDVEKLNNGNVY